MADTSDLAITIRAVPPTDDDIDAAAEALAAGRNVLVGAEDLPPDPDGTLAMKLTLSPEPSRG